MNRQVKGYFTVEAALLFPFVTGVILLVIYLWFFQYDRCLLELDTGILSLRGSVLYTEQKKNIMEKLERESDRLSVEKYIAWEKGPFKVKLEKDKVYAKGEGEVVFPFKGLAFWNGGSLWKIEAACENHIINPALFLRTCRKILDYSALEAKESGGE